MNILRTLVDASTKDRACRDGFNSLTKEMQEYFDGEFSKKHDHTYVFDPHEPRTHGDRFIYPLRHPGSTIGHIEVDENGIILYIEIYETYHGGKSIPGTTGPYVKEVLDMVKKYIGWKYECVEASSEKIVICDYHELYDIKLRDQLNEHEGINVNLPDGSWFKFCKKCISKYGIFNMINEMYERAERGE